MAGITSLSERNTFVYSRKKQVGAHLLGWNVILKKSPCQHYCEYKLLRKTYINFVVYNSNKKNGQWWYFQMGNDQIKFFLKQKYPNTRFGLLLDNVPSHFHIDHAYLNFRFWNSFICHQTVRLEHPLDLSGFDTLENQYSSWLMRETLRVVPKNLKLESCVHCEYFEQSRRSIIELWIFGNRAHQIQIWTNSNLSWAKMKEF